MATMTGDPQARERLEAERQRTLQRLADLAEDFASTVAASLDSNADDEHDPEGATIAFERSQVTSLSRQLRQRLGDIDAAVQRWEAGTYGECTGCGQPISPARLEARPAAATCVACASRRG
jgi:DnaK suppressor protein